MIIGLTGRRDDGGSVGAGKDAVADVLVREFSFVRLALADAVKRVAQQLYGFTDEQLWGSLKEAPDLRYPRSHGPWRDGVCLCCRQRGMDANGHFVATTCYLTPRFALQIVGTEMGRTLFEDTWVDLALRMAKELLEEVPYFYGGHETSLGHRFDQKPGHLVYDRTIGVVEGFIAEGAPVGVVIPDVRWPAGNEGKAILAAGGKLWRVDRPGTSGIGGHASETQPAPDDLFEKILHNDGSLVDLETLVREAMQAQ